MRYETLLICEYTFEGVCLTFRAFYRLVTSWPVLSRIRAKSPTWTLGPGVRIMAVERDGNRWVISAAAREIGTCSGCEVRSRRRHSRYSRCLQDLPAQGAVVALRVLMTRWRCLNGSCARRTFSDQLPGVAARHARRTLRVSSLLQLFAHGAGGKPSERLINRLGMPASDDTLLRQLKRGATRRINDVRVLGIDDWSWRKGESYGTVMVDLERREVVDVLPGRSTEETADWLRQHRNVEVVSRDRCGLYAQGIRQGAPKARQWLIGFTCCRICARGLCTS
jgi:transposase